MKMMHSAGEKNLIKKKFQKPNILRKSSWQTQRTESHTGKYLVTNHNSSKPLDSIKKENITPCKFTKMKKAVKKLPEIFEITDNDYNDEMRDTSKYPSGNINAQINNNNEDMCGGTLYIEKILHSSVNDQNDLTKDTRDKVLKDNGEILDLNCTTEEHGICKTHYDGSQPDSTHLHLNSDLLNNMVPLSEVTSDQSVADGAQEVIFIDNIPRNDHSVNNYGIVLNYQCKLQNCDKVFTTGSKLTEHIIDHCKCNKTKHHRSTKQINIECPAKRVIDNDEKKPCGRIFPTREEVWNHLKEDHTLDDASYICDVCGRRFFWSGGLRAHGRSHCGRGAAVACEWPGCGRVFRQPCRLREHARAHNGDKPYHCQHPNCGWSFRSASKLERHARRHKGERRHVCVSCGRAFLRREHLRDHFARYHAPHGRALHACTSAGCEQSFPNMSSLYLHMKKVHRNEKTVAKSTSASSTETLPQNVLTINTEQATSLDLEGSPAGIEDTDAVVMELGTEVDLESQVEWHSARTHCTWPLPHRDATDYEDTAYVLEQDVQVDQSESSESNVYTIRSDLFLHSNIPFNEDSQNMVAVADCVAEAETEAERVADAGSLVLLPHATLDHDLGLDTHTTIDLMQEQLMYTEEAVDESSFRVFLLSGEELIL